MYIVISVVLILLLIFVVCYLFFFFFNDPAPTEIYPLSLPAALPIFCGGVESERFGDGLTGAIEPAGDVDPPVQHGGAQLLNRLGERGRGRPAAVGGEDRRRHGEGGRQGRGPPLPPPPANPAGHNPPCPYLFGPGYPLSRL